jgi:hypothetical protein
LSVVGFLSNIAAPQALAPDAAALCGVWSCEIQETGPNETWFLRVRRKSSKMISDVSRRDEKDESKELNNQPAETS